jgi:hypothetical protein
MPQAQPSDMLMKEDAIHISFPLNSRQGRYSANIVENQVYGIVWPEVSKDSSQDSGVNSCMLSRVLGRSGVKVDCGEWQADDSGCAGAMRVRLVPRHKDKTTS